MNPIPRIPKALLNFQWTVGVDKIFFSVIKCRNSRISPLSSSMFSYVWIAVSIKHGLWTADLGLWTADHGLRTGYKTRTRHKMWTGNYALKLDSADTVMILTSRMMMWFLFSQSVLHITGVWDLDKGFVKIELCKTSILMVLCGCRFWSKLKCCAI